VGATLAAARALSLLGATRRRDTARAPWFEPLPEQQRFCPTCNRAFDDGEAVLRCAGCAVLQHPGCWVRKAGCATPGEHNAAPQAVAYVAVRSEAATVPHPGEGIRIRSSRVVGGAPGPEIAADENAGSVIPMRRTTPQAETGYGTPNVQRPARQIPPLESVRAAADERGPKRRAARAPVEPQGRLPRIYGQHHLVRGGQYLVAALIAVAVAVAVIWAGAQVVGGDDDEDVGVQPLDERPAGVATAAGTPATLSQPTTAAGTPAAAATTGGATLGIGAVAVVTNTGDCLNVRTAPGTANPAIVCLKDGSEVTVTGGPEDVAQLRWWKVRTGSGEGWAAGDYLQPRR